MASFDKQIILTQNDTGIAINIPIVNKKVPVNLTDRKVNIDVVKPDGTMLLLKDVFIQDAVQGVVVLIVNKQLTEQAGLYKCYISITDAIGNDVTTQSDLFFYVKAEHGGVS